MTDLAGFGSPSWLPPTIARQIAAIDAREALDSRRAQAEREKRAEEYHQRAMVAYRDAAEARGEVVDALDLAAGRVQGRTVQDVFAEALQQAARDDLRAEARAHRDGHGDPVHIDFEEPVIHAAPAARSAAKWAMTNRYRHWREALEARRAADLATKKAAAAADDYGIVDGVVRGPKPGAGTDIYDLAGTPWPQGTGWVTARWTP